MEVTIGGLNNKYLLSLKISGDNSTVNCNNLTLYLLPKRSWCVARGGYPGNPIKLTHLYIYHLQQLPVSLKYSRTCLPVREGKTSVMLDEFKTLFS